MYVEDRVRGYRQSPITNANQEKKVSASANPVQDQDKDDITEGGDLHNMHVVGCIGKKQRDYVVSRSRESFCRG